MMASPRTIHLLPPPQDLEHPHPPQWSMMGFQPRRQTLSRPQLPARLQWLATMDNSTKVTLLIHPPLGPILPPPILRRLTHLQGILKLHMTPVVMLIPLRLRGSTITTTATTLHRDTPRRQQTATTMLLTMVLSKPPLAMEQAMLIPMLTRERMATSNHLNRLVRPRQLTVTILTLELQQEQRQVHRRVTLVSNSRPTRLLLTLHKVAIRQPQGTRKRITDVACQRGRGR